MVLSVEKQSRDSERIEHKKCSRLRLLVLSRQSRTNRDATRGGGLPPPHTPHHHRGSYQASTAAMDSLASPAATDVRALPRPRAPDSKPLPLAAAARYSTTDSTARGHTNGDGHDHPRAPSRPTRTIRARTCPPLPGAPAPPARAPRARREKESRSAPRPGAGGTVDATAGLEGWRGRDGKSARGKEEHERNT